MLDVFVLSDCNGAGRTVNVPTSLHVAQSRDLCVCYQIWAAAMGFDDPHQVQR